MRVKHGAKVKFTLKCGRTILERRIIPIEILDGAITTVSYMYNGLIDGGVMWRDPGTGGLLPKTPSWTAVLIDPNDELMEGQMCDCQNCKKDDKEIERKST